MPDHAAAPPLHPKAAPHLHERRDEPAGGTAAAVRPCPHIVRATLGSSQRRAPHLSRLRNQAPRSTLQSLRWKGPVKLAAVQDVIVTAQPSGVLALVGEALVLKKGSGR